MRGDVFTVAGRSANMFGLRRLLFFFGFCITSYLVFGPPRSALERTSCKLPFFF